MASDVLSLFGLNPDVIQQGRIQSGVDTAARMDRDYAIGAAGGQMLGSALGSAFGLETPEMRERNIIDQSLQGVDLETPEGLRQAAQQLRLSGDYGRAMALVSAANQLEAEQLSVTRDEETRALGKSSSIIVEPASYDKLNNKTIPEVIHSITEYYDGTVLNNTTGKTYPSRAAMFQQMGDAKLNDDGDDNTDVNLKWRNGDWAGNPSGRDPDVAPDPDSVSDSTSESEFVNNEIREAQDKLDRAKELLATTNNPQLQPLVDQAEKEFDEVKVRNEAEQAEFKKSKAAALTKSIEELRQIISAVAKFDANGNVVIIDTPATNQARIKLERLQAEFESLTGEPYDLKEY